MIPISGVLLLLALRNSDKKLRIVRILIILAIFFIDLRIMVSNGLTTIYKSNYDIVFVVDNTISMVAEDYKGNARRLDAVKSDLKYIMDNLPSSTYSIITFDNKSYIRTPLSYDRDSIDVVIDTMAVKKSFYATGTSLTIFKDDLKTILSSSAKKSGHKRIVFLVSDGENTSDKKLDDLSGLKNLIDDGAVLGYGTSAGGYMREEFYDGEYSYIEDRTGDYPWPKALSKIDENTLQKFAKELGIDYIHMDNSGKIDGKLNKIKNSMDLDSDEEQESYDDLYYLFAIPLSVLLIVELYFDKKTLL